MRFLSIIKTDLVAFLVVAVAIVATCFIGVVLMPSAPNEIVIMRGDAIAIAVLLAARRNLWPGVFLGAFLGRIYLEQMGYALVAGGTGIGRTLIMSAATTLQAWIAATVVTRLCGTPIRLAPKRSCARVFFVLGPIALMLVPSLGTALLAVDFPNGKIDLQHYWVIWWLGTLIALVFTMPIALLGPWHKEPTVYWNNVALPRLGPQLFGFLMVTALLTISTWHQVSRMDANSVRAEFVGLAGESQRALEHRIDSYVLALGAGRGLWDGSSHVTLDDWQQFVQALTLSDALAGITGLGFIQEVLPEDVPQFLDAARKDGVADFKITNATATTPMFIVKYIEPAASNPGILGLNAAFEVNRLSALSRARDTGKTTFTNPVRILQSNDQSLGFLAMTPVYSTSIPADSVQARRDTLIGLVYAPIVANQLFDALTLSQKDNLKINAYSGAGVDPARQFYSNATDDSRDFPSKFHVTKQLNILGQVWTLTWASTKEFEAANRSFVPMGVFIAGTLFSLLVALFSMSLIHSRNLVEQTVARRTRELAEKVEENNSVIETGVAKVALLDPQGTVLRYNHSFAQLLECPKGDLAGSSMSTLLQGQLDHYFTQPDLGPDHPPYRGELDAVSASGEAFAVDVQINPWHTSDGQRRFTLVMRDITQYRQVADLLRATQNRLELALTGANIGVFDIDLRTNTSVVSQTWRDLLGFSDDEESAPQANWLKRVHPDDLPKVHEADEACIEGRAALSVSEYRVRMNDGSWRWMRSRAVGEDRDETGRAWRLIGLQTDVTDQRQVDELKRQFVSTVSHELRTPLTSINGSLSLLLNAMSADIPAPAKRMLTIAQRNCDRLVMLVNDILDMEKLETSQPAPTLVPMLVSEQVKRALQVNRPYAERLGVSLILSGQLHDCTALMEERRFQQIMANLLSNAAKFSPKDGKVRVKISQDHDKVTIAVTDQGRGIPEGSRDVIFKPFSQVDGSASRDIEGTGLGLHIAQKIAHQMGGEIDFTSEPHVATTFFLRLNCAKTQTALLHAEAV